MQIDLASGVCNERIDHDQSGLRLRNRPLQYAAKAWLECGGPVEEYKELYEAIR